MKQVIKLFVLIIAVMLFNNSASIAQTSNSKTKNTTMNTYVIEREIPDAGKFTPEQLKGISQTSCSVLKELGAGIEWVHSYVTGNKIYCIYKAQNEEIIREHAKKGGFPANVITQVSSVISPATAEGN